MRPVVVAKYVTALAGLLVFGAGMRTGSEALRWTGIGIVAAAWLLRFLKEPSTHDSGSERSSTPD